MSIFLFWPFIFKSFHHLFPSLPKAKAHTKHVIRGVSLPATLCTLYAPEGEAKKQNPRKAGEIIRISTGFVALRQSKRKGLRAKYWLERGLELWARPLWLFNSCCVQGNRISCILHWVIGLHQSKCWLHHQFLVLMDTTSNIPNVGNCLGQSGLKISMHLLTQFIFKGFQSDRDGSSANLCEISKMLMLCWHLYIVI